MRIYCSCPTKTASSVIVGWCQQLGFNPTVTEENISVTYEGGDKVKGEALVQMFSHEADHEIVVRNGTNGDLDA